MPLQCNPNSQSKLAATCTEALGLSLPTLADTMDDIASISYNAWPERIYVITKENKMDFRFQPGPFGFKTKL